MTGLGKNIFEHDFGHRVYAMATSEKCSKRVAVQMYVVCGDGSISDITTITRKDVYTKKNCFEFFYDMEDFGRDDIEKIRMGVLDILKDREYRTNIQNKATLEEIHDSISRFIRGHAVEVSKNKANEVFIQGNYGYLATTEMEVFIKLNKDLGYKRLDVLKRLKIMGVLQCGKNRPYDILVSLYGVKKRYYKIELAENVLDMDEEAEVIDTEEIEVMEDDN